MDVTIQWTAESLHDLFVSNGFALRAARSGPLFVAVKCTPTPARPGAPEHPKTDCLEWAFGKISGGYGGVGNPPLGMRTCSVHSVAYELTHGPVPSGAHLGHLCENPPCGRPDHVRPVTPVKNCREGALRRWPSGLMDLAPAETCRVVPSHGTMQAYVQISKSQRHFWRLRCRACRADNIRSRSKGITVPLTVVAHPMDPVAYDLLLRLLSGTS